MLTVALIHPASGESAVSIIFVLLRRVVAVAAEVQILGLRFFHCRTFELHQTHRPPLVVKQNGSLCLKVRTHHTRSQNLTCSDVMSYTLRTRSNNEVSRVVSGAGRGSRTMPA